jgi:dTDP-4-amino-4,6-dideoxygalactose transaminase
MEWRVKYIDYPSQYRKLEKELLSTIQEVLSRGDLLLRKNLEDFENTISGYVGVNHTIGVNSGTDALHLAVEAAGIQPADEIITSSHTFVATGAAIHHSGAKPVLVDIGEDHNIDASLIENMITDKTKAIMPVHLNGRLCDMDKITAIANKYNLLIIEDAAQALGATFKGKKAGSFGLAGCFSFYPAKLLGAYGDAGAVVTSDDSLAKNISYLRNHGRMDNGEVSGWAYNTRLDNLQAAILQIKFKKFPSWIERRRQIASIYNDGLEKISHLRLPNPPVESGDFFDVYQNYEIEAESKDKLRTYLTQQGIETMLPWGGKGLHQFKSLNLSEYSLPRTEEMFDKAIMIPMHPDLEDHHLDYVIKTINQFYRN